MLLLLDNFQSLTLKKSEPGVPGKRELRRKVLRGSQEELCLMSTHSVTTQKRT
jgi:hypothetical protein